MALSLPLYSGTRQNHSLQTVSLSCLTFVQWILSTREFCKMNHLLGNSTTDIIAYKFFTVYMRDFAKYKQKHINTHIYTGMFKHSQCRCHTIIFNFKKIKRGKTFPEGNCFRYFISSIYQCTYSGSKKKIVPMFSQNKLLYPLLTWSSPKF